MKKVHRFWPFMKADFRAAEAYLEKQAKKGLHITHIDSFGVCVTYEKGEPKDVKYSIDYYGGEYEEKENYKRLLSDAGWNHVADMDAYMIFSSEQEADPVPIHTEWTEAYRLLLSLWKSEILLGLFSVVLAYFALRANINLVTREQWVSAFCWLGIMGFGMTDLLHGCIIYWKTTCALRCQTRMTPLSYGKALLLGTVHAGFGAWMGIGVLLRIGLVLQDIIADGNTGAVSFFFIFMFSAIVLFIVGKLPKELLPKKVYIIISMFLLFLMIAGLIGLLLAL